MYYKHHKLSYQQSSLMNCCYMYYKHHKLSYQQSSLMNCCYMYYKHHKLSYQQSSLMNCCYMYYKHHKLSYQQSSLINCCYMYYKHHKLSLKCKHHDFLHTRAIHLSSVQRVSCVFISFSTISGQPFHRACILQWRNYRSYFYTSKVTLHDYTNNIHQTDNS